MSNLKERYINPLTDFGFKKLFGTEPNKVLLIDFLNQVLPDRKIKDLTYASNEKMGRSEMDRKAIFDLYCTGVDGEKFIVEMQKAKQNFFKDRSVFYASFPIQEQEKKSEWDYKLEPVYFVGILDFIFDDHKHEEELLHLVELKNQRCEVFYEKLKFIYIELPKFQKSEEELETHFDKWLYVFTHLYQLTDRPKKLQERIFARLFEAAEIARFAPEERKAYEDSLKYYRDMKNVVDTAKEEGLVEGMEKGIEKGMEKKSIEIARQMKTEGFSDEQIARLTGLTSNEIRDL
ncbi:MAG: Rpn family recombination-promoting nuclease/putative transposase [Lewinellaceae bacterium]|nr:Rpn family recombination-promoting nuclease/putative transposase [Saprospiraceae bacterium]MCB9341879.1 Rpn family recombination-promoting nuclease/putative transposase [Lewinellaceae bacterium]